MSWAEFQPTLVDFWQQARGKIAPRYAPGRLKQWLALLTRNYPEAVALFAELRRENDRSEEHTSELQSLMRISYAVFCLKKKNYDRQTNALTNIPINPTPHIAKPKHKAQSNTYTTTNY